MSLGDTVALHHFWPKLLGRLASCGTWCLASVASAQTERATIEDGSTAPSTTENAPTDATSELAEADVAATSGPELGARTGYATPFGHGLRADVTSGVPFWLDAGYRIDRRWFVGVFGHYGLGVASETSGAACPDCSYTWVRYGLQAQYRFYDLPDRNLWVGLSVGQELFNVAIDSERRSTRSLKGWELFNLQFGSEWEPTDGLGLGPYLSFSLGRFTDQVETCEREALCPMAERRVETTLDGAPLHGWINVGLRIVALP